MVKGRIDRQFVRWAMRGIALLLLGFVLFLGGAVWSVWEKERTTHSALMAVQAERESLAERKSSLEGDLTALDTDRGVEAAIRERYPLARPGEEVITLVTPPAPTTTEPVAQAGIWGIIKSWVGL